MWSAPRRRSNKIFDMRKTSYYLKAQEFGGDASNLEYYQDTSKSKQKNSQNRHLKKLCGNCGNFYEVVNRNSPL